MKADSIDSMFNFKVTHPLQKAHEHKNRYWTDFLSLTADYKKYLNNQDYSHFLKKSRLDCAINNAEYLQFASEVTIVDYIIRNYNGFQNEPRYDNRKNPECSFEYEGRTVNVEVKCPDLRKRAKQESSEHLKIYTAERFPSKQNHDDALKFIASNIKGNETIQVVDRLDNKLKDYLLSAHKKFPSSGSKYFNILVISLETIYDMDEWYNYIFGADGVFTNRTYVSENYNNVDAIMITNVQYGHMAEDVNLNINCWHLENYVSLLFLNPLKENNLGKYYFEHAIKLFGNRTEDFILFLENLDQLNALKISDVQNISSRKELSYWLYLDNKITSLHSISEWIKYNIQKEEPQS